MLCVRIAAIEKTIPLRAYVDGVKKAKAHPAAEFKHGLTCWWPCTGAEIVDQFYRGVEERINSGIPHHERPALHRQQKQSA